MKTYLTYGAAMTAGNTLLTFTLYFLNYHSDPEKFQSAGWIANIGTLLVGITCIVLGMRARRAEVPAYEDFNYGRALGAGVMVGLFAAAFGVVTSYIYFQFVNPGFSEVAMRSQAMAMEANGTPPAQIEAAQKIGKMFMHPALLAIFSFLGGMFFCTLISLIAAIFVRRPATANPPDLPPATV